jgi:hypothetical protein
MPRASFAVSPMCVPVRKAHATRNPRDFMAARSERLPLRAIRLPLRVVRRECPTMSYPRRGDGPRPQQMASENDALGRRAGRATLASTRDRGPAPGASPRAGHGAYGCARPSKA